MAAAPVLYVEPEEEPSQPHLRFCNRIGLSVFLSDLTLKDLKALTTVSRSHSASCYRTLSLHALRRAAMPELTHGAPILDRKIIAQRYHREGAYKFLLEE